MKKKKKEKRKVPQRVAESTKKAVLTSFILLFPALVIVSLMANLPLTFYAISLFFYQAILIKNFLDDHYKHLE